MTTSTSDSNTTTRPAITGISHVDLSVTDHRASAAWYTNLLGAPEVFTHRNDEHHLASTVILHEASLLLIGFMQHDKMDTAAFSEHRVGLDHLSFNVGSAQELKDWAAFLDGEGIAHSDIVEGDMWDVLALRDPDNIQLEFFYMKPAAAEIVS